ncbi:MAG: metallophosphoesterase family protein [Gemmatimonadaceae bacterium]|nr:metallophosphoesterase family protein [Gemmatimonadaceae bacterium]
MRIAALYDIHGNLPALEAVLADVRDAAVDLVVMGGDVLPGPMPHESLAALAALAALADDGVALLAIRGNGDRTVLEARRGTISPEVPAPIHDVMRWNAAQLTPHDAAWMEGWPTTATVEHDALGRILFCHATPRSDTEIFTQRTAEARIAPAFDGVDAALVVCGHTHMTFDRTIAGRRVVNAGSVGMPFGETGARWLLIDRDVEFRHTTYDLDAAAARIRTTAYPRAEHFAAHNVLTTPTAEAMLAALER